MIYSYEDATALRKCDNANPQNCFQTEMERIIRRILVSEPQKWSYLDKYHTLEFVGELE